MKPSRQRPEGGYGLHAGLGRMTENEKGSETPPDGPPSPLTIYSVLVRNSLLKDRFFGCFRASIFCFRAEHIQFSIVIATRYDKPARNFLADVRMACAPILLD